MATIKLDNYHLHYITAGHPGLPPLLLVHGWGSYGGVWQQTMALLKDHYYCIAVDLPGFGNSDKPKEGDYSIPAQGRRLLHLADTLGFDTFTLAGHSMGGQISLYLASVLAPARVSKLVNVAGVVTARLKPRAEMIFRLSAVSAASPQIPRLTSWLCAHFRGYAKFVFRAWFYDIESIPWEAWEKDRQMALQTESYLSLYKAGQAIHQLNLTAELPQITAPTLTIFGQQDETVYVSDGQLVAQHVPNSKLVLIDKCGHFPMLERPQQYAHAVREFLL